MKATYTQVSKCPRAPVVLIVGSSIIVVMSRVLNRDGSFHVGKPQAVPHPLFWPFLLSFCGGSASRVSFLLHILFQFSGTGVQCNWSVAEQDNKKRVYDKNYSNRSSLLFGVSLKSSAVAPSSLCPSFPRILRCT